MTARPRLAAATLLTAIIAACSSGPPPTPTPSPSLASPTASPTTTPQRDLASLPPEEGWRPLLELISGSGGRDAGGFDVDGRYRIRYDCVGAGSIRVRVDGEVRVTRACADGEIEEPVVVRQAAGRLRAVVVTEGDPDWIVRIEVAR